MTPVEAAQWMKSLLDENGMLYQSEAASELIAHDDDRLAYYDDQGSLCVGKAVLTAFRKITPDAVYLRTDKMWRQREDYHLPGRQQ